MEEVVGIGYGKPSIFCQLHTQIHTHTHTKNRAFSKQGNVLDLTVGANMRHRENEKTLLRTSSGWNQTHNLPIIT